MEPKEAKQGTAEGKQVAVKKAAEYTAAELANAASRIFGVPQDVVTAALRMAGVKSATIDEAKKIVTKFAKKEVK